MDNKELLSYLQKRVAYLNRIKLSHIFFAVRNKNEGKIEEIEDIIKRIKTGNLENPDHD